MKLKSLKVGRIRPLLKGVFSPSIPYEIRNESGRWSDYFGTYESQKHDDVDSNCCWAYAGNEVLEDQLTFLRDTGKFSKSDITWFKDNGYIDSDGDFYLSRRWIPILSGVKAKGNDESEFWRLTKKYGAIPNAFLPYTNNIDYFDKAFLTQGMRDLGQEFLKRVNIQYEELGTRFSGYSLSDLKKALKQSPLQIGIPVPQDNSWNQVRVKYAGGANPDHSVELYEIDETKDFNYPIFIYDQYQPYLKQLSRDTYIPVCTKAVINPEMLSPQLSLTVWQQFVKLLMKLGIIN